MSQFDRYYQQGLFLLKQGDNRGAIAALTRAIKLEPDYSSAYSFRGEAHSELRNYTEALADFSKAIALNPQEAYLYCLRGWTKEELKDYQGAISDFDRAIVLNYYDAKVYISRGYAHRVLGNLQNAIADYTKAIAIEPENWHGYSHRGYARQAAGDISGAIEDFTKVVRLNPNDADANKQLSSLIEAESVQLKGKSGLWVGGIGTKLKNVFGRNNQDRELTLIYRPKYADEETISACLIGADLRGANLTRANLAEADLRDACLIETDLRGANLEGTKFEGAIYDEDTEFPSGFAPEAAEMEFYFYEEEEEESDPKNSHYLETAEEILGLITHIKAFETLWLDTEIADWQTKHPRLSLIQVLADPQDLTNDAAISIAIGVDLEGKLVEADLADPNNCHFLIGGTPGSGKSEFLRSLLLSLIYRHSPEQVKIALVDPKRVTFPEFTQMPWLLSPVVKDSEAAISLMEELVTEMDKRYQLFETAGCLDLDAYNQKQTSSKHNLPRIVCIFDEYADFMVEKETRIALEASIKRLGGMARASGIHLIIATQRPEAGIVTPIIRSNLPGRIALSTSGSEGNSKIILGGSSTEAAYLLGTGDLFLQVNAGLQRLQSLYAPEIEFP